MHKLKITLSERLKALRSFREDEKYVWDIGCDHGDLGLSFAYDNVEVITLVDPSRPVIDTLQLKLSNIDSYITKPKISVLHSKGQQIKTSSSSNIFFIAGMGGTEILEIIQNLLPQIDSTSSIVISPHRKILELRKELHNMDVGLVTENSLFENSQFYQILHLRRGISEKVSLYGTKIWEGEIGKAYREHQISAFSRHQDPQSKDYFEYLKNLNH